MLKQELQQYFAFKDIKGEKQVIALLTLFGRKTYNLLRNVTAPAKPAEM